MRIAYICRSFAPRNNIASIRHSKLVKYLVRKGWEVTVFTEEIDEREIIDPLLFCKEFEQIKIIKLPTGKNVTDRADYSTKKYTHDNSRTASWKQSLFYKLVRSTWYFLRDFSFNLNFYQLFCESLDKSHPGTDYDLVFSSYMPMGAHWSADYLKRTKSKRAIWIAEFRDLVNDDKRYPFFLRWVMSALQVSICNRADGVTAVSNGFRERIIEQKLIRKDSESIITLTSGYDPDEFESIQVVSSDPQILSICYTGHIFPQSRDASMLFEVIAQLVQEEVTRLDRIKLIYAGPTYDYLLLYDQARPFGVEAIIDNRGYVPHTRALEIQRGSDLLLLLTSNMAKEKGVLTGKIMEYIGMNRPILAMITGDKKNSEVSGILERYKIGSSFYYLDRENAKIAIKAGLIDYIEQKKKNGFVEHNPDRSGLESYSYDNIADKLLTFYNFLRSKTDKVNG